MEGIESGEEGESSSHREVGKGGRSRSSDVDQNASRVERDAVFDRGGWEDDLSRVFGRGCGECMRRIEAAGELGRRGDARMVRGCF